LNNLEKIRNGRVIFTHLFLKINHNLVVQL
jgi:hypothetical protein